MDKISQDQPIRKGQCNFLFSFMKEIRFRHLKIILDGNDDEDNPFTLSMLDDSIKNSFMYNFEK